MKNKIYFLGLFLILFVACFTDIPKSEKIRSDSREQSKISKMYIGEYDLIRVNEFNSPKDSIIFDCWAEYAATTQNAFFFFPKRKKLDFFNFFLKINKEICENYRNVEYKIPTESNWKSVSCVEEPKLGLYFQIRENVKIEDVKIKVKRSNDSCVYYLLKKD